MCSSLGYNMPQYSYMINSLQQGTGEPAVISNLLICEEHPVLLARRKLQLDNLSTEYKLYFYKWKYPI